jgi:glycosyltransferase involved in cell wall biosynthesis
VPEAKIICETEQNLFKHLPLPFEFIRKYVQNRSDLIIGRSEEAVQMLRRKGYQGATEVVPNAVDGDLFRPMDRAKCRRDLGVEGFVVGYVGRLVEAKGLSDLLEAIALCPAAVNLVIVGSGSYEPEIIHLIAKLNLGTRVRMIGAVPSDQLPEMFNAMDVLAVPSRTTPRWKEQFGRVIIEAHACGLAVVGSDSGAIPQVIGDGGIVVQERNPRALANAFSTLQENETMRTAMGEAGLRAATRNFTWMAVAKQMRELYARVLSHSKQGEFEISESKTLVHTGQI